MLTTLLLAAMLLQAVESQQTAVPQSETTSTQQHVTMYVYCVDRSTGTVLLDGQELAKIDRNRIFGVRLSPGQHRMELRSTPASPPLIFNVDAGKTYYVREERHLGEVGQSSSAIIGTLGWVQDLTLVTETAQKDIKKKDGTWRVQPTKDSDIKNHEIVFVPSLNDVIK